MPTKQQEKPPPDQEKQQGQQRNAVIGKQVMQSLGQPGDLQRVQVRQLWEGHYRVNVVVGADYANTRVAHSFFLLADGDGNITASTPQITKKY